MRRSYGGLTSWAKRVILIPTPRTEERPATLPWPTPEHLRLAGLRGLLLVLLDYQGAGARLLGFALVDMGTGWVPQYLKSLLLYSPFAFVTVFALSLLHSEAERHVPPRRGRACAMIATAAALLSCASFMGTSYAMAMVDTLSVSSALDAMLTAPSNWSLTTLLWLLLDASQFTVLIVLSLDKVRLGPLIATLFAVGLAYTATAALLGLSESYFMWQVQGIELLSTSWTALVLPLGWHWGRLLEQRFWPRER